MLGKERLQETPWTAPLFARALDDDLGLLDDEPHIESAADVADLLADHIAFLRVTGRTDELHEYFEMLREVMLRYPDLTRIQDLDPVAQIGVQLDALFEDLYATEQVPTPARARDLLAGHETRRRIMEVLVEADDSLTTPEITSLARIQSRQHTHQLLRKLHDVGLVALETGSKNRYSATPLAVNALHELEKDPKQKILLYRLNPSEQKLDATGISREDTDIRA